MYLYTFYLFFDFAGYSLMAVGSSNILGISTPMNFNKPFLSIDIKDFWNRWHISLSTWLRDFVFSRVFMEATKKKRFKKRLTTAMYAYMVNMLLMGFWHGLTISYIIYGFYHGVLMAGFEYYQKKSKFYKVNRSKTWYKILSWFITINLIMIGLYIFSGEPYKIITTIFVIKKSCPKVLLIKYFQATFLVIFYIFQTLFHTYYDKFATAIFLILFFCTRYTISTVIYRLSFTITFST